MSNFFQKITQLDPITHAVSPGGKYDYFKHTVGPAPPAYDPSQNPGATLQAPPPGGPMQAPPPTGGYTPPPPPGPAAGPGYTPNFFAAGGGAPPPGVGSMQNGASGPGAALGPAQGMPPINPFRGGTPQPGQGGPPPMANTQPMPGGSDIQRQMLMAHMLRGGGGMMR